MGLYNEIEMLIDCSNPKCDKLLVVDTATVFHSLIFKETAKVVECPVCGQKTLVTIQITAIEKEENTSDKK